MSKKEALIQRAELLKKARAFFEKKGYLEVDCPSLCQYPPLDDHIDVFEVPVLGEIRYLHTSPEYGMKKLLSEGIGNIYQISRVFRKGEIGRLHNPEFTMAEWYKLGLSFEEFIAETCEFISLFLPDVEVIKRSYRSLFFEKTGMDPRVVPREELIRYIQNLSLEASPLTFSLDKDGLLQWIMGMVIEPSLQGNCLYVIDEFPATQAALAEVMQTPEGACAMRFEIYYQGIELANGYKELRESLEQRKRFEVSNEKRISSGKAPYPLDENLLKALEKGIPSCCGVAAGFDRLVMLALKKASVEEVIPFQWTHA